MNKIIDILTNCNEVTISGHINPDGDSIGSCFALALSLKKMGKKVNVLLDPYPSKYNIIPGRKLWVPSLSEPTEVFVAVDCASLDRLGSTKAVFDSAKLTVCIDHHLTNEGFADVNFIEPEASSTSEMIYTIVHKMVELDREIASAIYAGMVSDTGGFRYNATGRATMEIAAALMELGIPFTDIYNELMHMQRFAAKKTLGLALSNCEQYMDGRVVCTYITLEMLAEIGANPSDLDGVVEHLMSTRGAVIAVLIYEKTAYKKVKISLRSNGPNMGKIATDLGGGGHKMAAGADFIGTVEEAWASVKELIEEELLNHADRRD